MFVAKYPDFVAQVIFQDGSYAVFDGAKDMFKYYPQPEKIRPGKTGRGYRFDLRNRLLQPGAHRRIHGLVCNRAAMYTAPWGRNSSPSRKESDARGFMKDHKGKSLLRFKECQRRADQGAWTSAMRRSSLFLIIPGDRHHPSRPDVCPRVCPDEGRGGIPPGKGGLSSANSD